MWGAVFLLSIFRMNSHQSAKHLEAVNRICRVCGKWNKFSKSPRGWGTRPMSPCHKKKDDLKTYVDINLEEDCRGVHSSVLCRQCLDRLSRLKRVSAEKQLCLTKDLKELKDNAAHLWCRFDESITVEECPVCEHVERLKRPLGPKMCGFVRKVDESALRSSSLPTEVPKTSVSSNSDNFDFLSTSTPTKRETVPDLHFQEMDKSTCTFTSLQTEGASLSDTTTLSTEVHESMTIGQECPGPLEHQECVRPLHQLEAPLTKSEEEYFTKMVRIKMADSADKHTITAKTGGQPLVFRKMVQPRKKSSQARTPLKNKRARMIKKVRASIAGDAPEDTIKQHGAELKTTSAKVVKRLLVEAELEPPTKIDPEKSVQLRYKLGLSLRKYQVLKKFHRKLGIKVASNRKEKAVETEAQKDAVIVVEGRSFEVYSEVEEKTILDVIPCARIENLTEYITCLLDKYHEEGRLTWHNGAIPQDCIYIKVGGDHGKGSMKVMAQVVNVEKPNSTDNTSLITMVECKDTPDNLRRILSQYRKELEEMQGMMWRDKKVHLFFFGDYDFLTKVYGLSGAAGIHPCLFCTATKDQIEFPAKFKEGKASGEIQERTLDSITAEYKRFKKDGKNVKNAKLHSNVVRRPLVDIEVDHVCPPYLHLLLGITLKHNNLLEDECHKLDKKCSKAAAQGKIKVPVTNEEFSEPFLADVKHQKEMLKQARQTWKAAATGNREKDHRPSKLHRTGESVSEEHEKKNGTASLFWTIRSNPE